MKELLKQNKSLHFDIQDVKFKLGFSQRRQVSTRLYWVMKTAKLPCISPVNVHGSRIATS